MDRRGSHDTLCSRILRRAPPDQFEFNPVGLHIHAARQDGSAKRDGCAVCSGRAINSVRSTLVCASSSHGSASNVLTNSLSVSGDFLSTRNFFAKSRHFRQGEYKLLIQKPTISRSGRAARYSPFFSIPAFWCSPIVWGQCSQRYWAFSGAFSGHSTLAHRSTWCAPQCGHGTQ